jgi:uncharacterized protein YbjT (DUF2867 family)
MTPNRVLVAGATGRLGLEVVRELKARGCLVRALAHSPRRASALRALADDVCFADALRPTTLTPTFEGINRVFSCLGASVIPMPRYGRRPFTAVDYPANRNLVRASVAAHVEKFVYVSVFGADRLPGFDFIRGHEQVVEELRRSGVNYSVLRPTGFFSSMEEILLVASRGLLPEFGGGRARTNPIHEADLAVACVEAFDAPCGWEQDIGGPDALTRREIAAHALRAVGREARQVRVPVGVLRNAGRLLKPLNPRVGDLMTFIAEILVEDFVAPRYGTRRIADYFSERARELGWTRREGIAAAGGE